jgi:uncharacterized tellurite resistance protein B-like protein
MDIVTTKKLNILIQLAEADKHFAKEEREMIYQIAKERNFPEEAVAELIRHPQPIDTLGALSEPQRLDYLLTAVELVLVDQKVFESEVLFVKNIAFKLGFRASVVDFLLENFKKSTLDELKRKVFPNFLVG